MTSASTQSALFEVEPLSPHTERKQRARDRVEARIQIAPRQAVPYELNRVYQVDCVEAMRRLPDASVDILIADPPYNASKGNNWKWDNSVSLPGFGGKWSKVMADWDDMPLADYFAFTIAWLEQVKRVVRPTGSIWIHGTYHNIGIINFALQILSVEIINEVVWYKRTGF